MNRRGLLAMVHVAKKQLGLDDATYQAVLERVAGRSSAGALPDRDLLLVIDEFKRLGWVAAKRPGSDNPHVRKVWAVWADMCAAGIPREPTRAALRAFVERMTKVTDPEWLTPAQANVVIEGLKAWQARHAKEARDGR